MSEFAARISRVRMKAGGADLHVLVNQTPDDEKDFRASLMECARNMVEMATDSPLAGFFFIGFHEDGCHSTTYRVDYDKSPIPGTLMPAYVAEIVRRYVVAGKEARDVFAEMFEWVE